MQEPLNHQHKKHVFLHFLETFATFLQTWFSFLAPNSPLVPLVGSQNEWFLVGNPWFFQAENHRIAGWFGSGPRFNAPSEEVKPSAWGDTPHPSPSPKWMHSVIRKVGRLLLGGVIWGYINYQLCFSFFRIPEGFVVLVFFFLPKNVCASKQLHSRNLTCILRLIWCLANIVQFRSCRARARNTGAFVRGACE